MRLPMGPLSVLVTALAAVLLSMSVIAAPLEKANMGTALMSNTFEATVAEGMWLVEFFSPFCGHCRHFAPTWSMLVEMHGHLADSSNFHFGQVDCIAQGDLCSEHGIKGYPAVLLYADGKKIDQYDGDRTYELLSTFILTNARRYREQQSNTHN